MAAFSYQLPTIDSIFLPNTNTNYLHPDHNNPNLITTTSKFQESSTCHDDHSEDGNSLTTKQSTDSSTVSIADYNKLDGSGEQVSQQLSSIDKKRKKTNNSSKEYSAQPKGTREGTMCKKQKKCNGNGMRKYEEKEGKPEQKEEKKVPDEPTKGYIHVRARRGQATDSHSLAERVRREKISERMKILQKLVPGCDKVTGKALMLDEIINYVQSLQNQVEFLSLKLAALSHMFYDFGLDAFTIRPEGGLNGLAFPLPSLQESNPNQQQSTAFTDDAAASVALAQICPHLLDASVLLHPGQALNVFPQNNGSQLWDVDNHRQKLLNSAGSSDNLCSFH